MKYIAALCVMALIACNQKPAPTETSNQSTVEHTKTMVYAVDLNSVFHEDLNDEDFSDVAPISEQLVADVLEGKLKAYDPVSEEDLTT